jgi:hypothetical protein
MMTLDVDVTIIATVPDISNCAKLTNALTLEACKKGTAEMSPERHFFVFMVATIFHIG